MTDVLRYARAAALRGSLRAGLLLVHFRVLLLYIIKLAFGNHKGIIYMSDAMRKQPSSPKNPTSRW